MPYSFLSLLDKWLFQADTAQYKRLLGCLCFLSCIPLLYGLNWVDYMQNIDHCPELFCDFYQHYLPQAQMLVQDGGIHHGWFYPPLLALLLIPLAFSSNPLFIWGSIHCLTIGFMALWVSRHLKLRWPFALLLCLCSLPVLHGLKWGQISLILYTLLFWSLSYGPGWYAKAIAFTGAIKIYPLALGGVLIGKGNISLLIKTSLYFILLTFVLPVAILGYEQAALFWAQVFAGSETVTLIAPKFGGQALWPTLFRYFIDGTHIGLNSSSPILIQVSSLLIKSLWFFMCCGVVLLTARSFKRAQDLLFRSVLILSALLLLLSPSWHHYASCIPFLFAVLWRNNLSVSGRVFLICGWLIQAIPVVFLGFDLYYQYSAYGGTFWSLLLTWWAALSVLPDAGKTKPDRKYEPNEDK